MMSMPLAEYLKHKEVLSWEEAVDLLSQLVHSLDNLHQKGIVYGRLTPSTIDYDPDTGEIHLQGDDVAIESNNFLLYMAPEQIRGEALDRYSDIWSLGVLFYQLISGDFPFYATDTALLEYQILNEPPAILPQSISVPPGTSSVLMRTMYKDRQRRYATVGDFEGAISELHLERKSPILPRRRLSRPWLKWGILSIILVALGWGITLLTPGIISAMKAMTLLPESSVPPRLVVSTVTPTSPSAKAGPLQSPTITFQDQSNNESGLLISEKKNVQTPIPMASAKTPVPTPTLFLPTKTPTLLPTSTSTPTLIPPTPRPTPIKNLTQSLNVTLIAPDEGVAGNQFHFQWQPSASKNSLTFELVIWNQQSTAELMAHGMSPTSFTDNTDLTASVSILEGMPPLNLSAGGDYYWGVCIIRKGTTERLYCTEGRRFHYGGGGGGGGGGGSTGGGSPIDE